MPTAVAEIRSALAECRACVVEILNYRKDRTTFWNRLSITPVRDGSGRGDALHRHPVRRHGPPARRRRAAACRRKHSNRTCGWRRACSRRCLPPPEVEAGAAPRRPRLPPVRRPRRRRRGRRSRCRGTGWRLYLLDVSGHGVGAALLSFTLEHLLSPAVGGALLTDDAGGGHVVVPPARVAERLNRQFPMDRPGSTSRSCTA